METKDKVSIIIPTYNNAKYLADALDSIIAQTYPIWECIVIDDGSSDNTSILVKKYCHRHPQIKYIYQTNQGPAVARNNGIAMSTGKYILPLDSDDTLSSLYLEKAVYYLDTNPDIKLVYCLSDTLGVPNSTFYRETYQHSLLLWKNLIHISSMYRRLDFDKTNGYNPNMCEGLEDWDFYLSFLSPNDKVYRIDEPLLHIRKTDSSRTNNATKNLQKLTQQIFENHRDLYEPYIKDLVYYHGMWNYYAELYDSQQSSFKSMAYKIGKTLLSPYRLLKRTIKCFYHTNDIRHSSQL